AQDVPRLTGCESWQRIEEGEKAVPPGIFGGDRLRRYKPQGRSVRAVGLAIAVILVGYAAIVVEGRAPKHRAVVHHAERHVAHRLGMTKPARPFRDSKVTRIHKPDKLRRFVVEEDR